MGWIRKQFRRIRRRVKKLLSTKFGRIIGGIGLSMAMGWAAGKLFEGAKTLFGGLQGASGAAGTGYNSSNNSYNRNSNFTSWSPTRRCRNTRSNN